MIWFNTVKFCTITHINISKEEKQPGYLDGYQKKYFIKFNIHTCFIDGIETSVPESQKIMCTCQNDTGVSLKAESGTL